MRLAAALCVLVCAAGCPEAPAPDRSYVCTVQPLAFILRELADGRADVHPLLSPKDSPHTYTPLPRDIARADNALALFYVSDTMDGWSAQLPARRAVPVFDLTPKSMHLRMGGGEDHHSHGHGEEHAHSHEGDDPHFWMDPLAVKAVVPELVNVLVECDPVGADQYRRNGDAFMKRLDALHATLKSELAPVHHRGVVLMHPSMGYLLQRYGLHVAGVIEPTPGREPSVRDIVDLIELGEQIGVKVLFTEPQLPRRHADVLAETLGVPLHELDPNGGVPGRDTYESLLTYNARVLREALS